VTLTPNEKYEVSKNKSATAAVKGSRASLGATNVLEIDEINLPSERLDSLVHQIERILPPSTESMTR
jgi:hypothetical protein